MRSMWLHRTTPASTLNIAHRGASVAAPQNTLAAFEKALDLGADGVEFDVHLSSDGVPVVIHDFTVDSTTDGNGAVAKMTLAELKELDAGTTFGPEFTGERIPTLVEVLECLAPHDVLMNIEVKSVSPCNTGLEDAIVTQVKAHRVEEQVLFSSFNPISLWRLKRLAPEIPAGLLYSPGIPLPLRQAWLAPLIRHEARHPEHTMVDEKYMAWARDRGYQVNTWTVNEPEEMKRLIALGVDSIITNMPGVLRNLLEAGRQHTAS